jgi:hypothetical protein
MNAGQYKSFSNRLIDAMKANGHIASRSPNGICIRTLAEFSGASEQICRRYIRGDALPDYEKVIKIAEHLNTRAGWLLFGEEQTTNAAPQPKSIPDDLLHSIVDKSHRVYRDETGDTSDCADFVLELVRDVREIDTSKEILEKIINMAVNSISSYKKKEFKKAM